MTVYSVWSLYLKQPSSIYYQFYPVLPLPVLPSPVLPLPVLPSPVLPLPVLPLPVLPLPVLPVPVINNIFYLYKKYSYNTALN